MKGIINFTIALLLVSMDREAKSIILKKIDDQTLNAMEMSELISDDDRQEQIIIQRQKEEIDFLKSHPKPID